MLSVVTAWLIANLPFLITSVSCIGASVAVTVLPSRFNPTTLPTAKPVAKTTLPS